MSGSSSPLRPRAFAFVVILVGALPACTGGSASSGSASSASPTAPDDVSCDDVCSSTLDKCGVGSAQCSDSCAKLSPRVRACIFDAPTCDFNHCNHLDDPCATCSATQFCVTTSSIDSEIRCIDAPASCNGSTTGLCDCLMRAGVGPCSKGAQGCTEGGTREISCL